jgi:DNA-binding winged helix-turn-helix (wHTH) protein/tetratricopeptide (TPR) repeat protein
LTYCFGPFRLDSTAFQLYQDDRVLGVPPKVIDLLQLLVSQPTALVAITDNAITQVVSELRQALGDDAASPTYVQTVPRRGYRFVGEVRVLSADMPAAQNGEGPAADRRRTIAVSDFQNVNGDADIAWLGAGIAETLCNDLRTLRDLSVIDRAGLSENVRRVDLDAARRAALDWLVVGGYQRDAGRLRMTARVLDVATGEARAHARADGPVADALAVQDKLVTQLLADLQVPVPAAAAVRIHTRETSSIDAYRALTEGRLKLESLDLTVVPDAIRDFDRALTLDPRYALAYVGLAHARFWLYESSRMRNKPDDDELRLAIGHARRAVELDAGLGEAYGSLALFLNAAGKPDEAVDSGRRAVALEPHEWRHHFRLGVATWGDERLVCMAEVERQYPAFAFSYFTAAMVHVARGDLNEATAALERGLTEGEGRVGATRYPAYGLHWLCGLLMWAAGGDRAVVRCEVERELAAKATALYGVEYAMNAWDALGFLALEEGRAADAKDLFSRALTAYPDHARSLVGCAMACRALNEDARAAALFEHAERVIADLLNSRRSAEGVMARACLWVATGRATEACDTLFTMLDAEPPGRAGWTLPVEPWLAPIRDTPACQRVFARLAARAR